jgi:polyferredoxin
MGIDIRDGSQLECIQCALCIDACNEIMDKVERPRGLICYDTIAKQEATQTGLHEPIQLFRPRTLLYATLIAVVGAVMLFGAFSRTALQINVLHDRGVMFVALSDGGVRNGYTVKILNKLHEPRHVVLGLDGLPGASLTILGMEGVPRMTIPTDDLREVRVFITVPPNSLARLTQPQTPLSIVVKDETDATVTRRTTMFHRPP